MNSVGVTNDPRASASSASRRKTGPDPQIVEQRVREIDAAVQGSTGTAMRRLSFLFAASTERNTRTGPWNWQWSRRRFVGRADGSNSLLSRLRQSQIQTVRAH